MFTGLVQALGTVKRCQSMGADFQLSVAAPEVFMGDVRTGDSIAVNGVCLTVIQFSKTDFVADMSVETVNSTTVKKWRSGLMVNLEKALTLSTRLGGHIVTGHVDGVGRIIRKLDSGRSWLFEINAPSALHRYLAPKGSVTIDGVSLTINQFRHETVSINVVPHTLRETILQWLSVGSEVHIEVDILARYAEQLLRYRASDSNDSRASSSLSKRVLVDNGFLK